MKVLEALIQSRYDAATYLNQNGIRYNVDGSSGDWYVTYGVDAMPVSHTQKYATRKQAISALPEDVALSEEWEALDGED